MKKIPHNPYHKDSIYHRFIIDKPVKLGEIIRELGWGGNKLIKGGGIRINNKDEGFIKTWKKVTDPYFIVDSKTYISTNNGRSVITIER